MANDPPFATLNHAVSDSKIPQESNNQRFGITAEEIVAKLRRGDLLMAQGGLVADAVRAGAGNRKASGIRPDIGQAHQTEAAKGNF